MKLAGAERKAQTVAFLLPLSSKNASVDTQRLYEPEEVGFVQTQRLGCGGAIPLGLVESPLDQLAAGGIHGLMIRQTV